MGSEIMDRSVLKALAILDALSTAPEGMRQTELARKLDFPVSTTHRLVATLASQGYVQQDGVSGRYVLGNKIFQLQAASANRPNLARGAFPFLRKLARELDETTNLSTLSDGRVVYLESVAADRAVGLYTPPGTIAPAHCTAMGKVLLAHLGEAELEDWFNRYDLSGATSHSITEREAFRRHLLEIRRQGYALDDEEWVPGVRCVAAPVRDFSGNVVAAISISAPGGRLPPERVPAAAETVMGIAAAISGGLGYRGS
jgi:DNA-binding IclR family transcriptional regulator